jgi:hypothetical protein
MDGDNSIIISMVIIAVLAFIAYSIYDDFQSTTSYTSSVGGVLSNIYQDIKSFFTSVGQDIEYVGEKAISGVETVGKDIVGGVESVGQRIESGLHLPSSSILEPSGKPEVFNINNNIFTYHEAQLACEALGSKLATYNQVKEAQENGANWCNYGWSEDQMALYPIQKEYIKELEKIDPELKKVCGHPGVNGGYFYDTKLRFGANCYGNKPEPDAGKIIYEKGIPKHVLTGKNTDHEKILFYKKMLGEGNIDITPFSDEMWSSYSTKKSSYLLSPRYVYEPETPYSNGNGLGSVPKGVVDETPDN